MPAGLSYVYALANINIRTPGEPSTPTLRQPEEDHRVLYGVVNRRGHPELLLDRDDPLVRAAGSAGRCREVWDPTALQPLAQHEAFRHRRQLPAEDVVHAHQRPRGEPGEQRLQVPAGELRGMGRVQEEVTDVARQPVQAGADIGLRKAPPVAGQVGRYGPATVVHQVVGVQPSGAVVAERRQQPGRGPAVIGRDLQHDLGAQAPDEQIRELRFDIVEFWPEAVLVVGREAGAAQERRSPAVRRETLETGVAALRMQLSLRRAHDPQGGCVLAIQPDYEIEGELRYPTRIGSSAGSFAPCLYRYNLPA